MKLGQKIKRYRLINDIRQEDMAAKMGVSRATLINYEKGHTTINIDVPKETHMQLVVYDILGREVATLIDGTMSAGYQSMTWNTKSISGIPVGAGVYFYQVRTADFVDTKKMVILK